MFPAFNYACEQKAMKFITAQLTIRTKLYLGMNCSLSLTWSQSLWNLVSRLAIISSRVITLPISLLPSIAPEAVKKQQSQIYCKPTQNKNELTNCPAFKYSQAVNTNTSAMLLTFLLLRCSCFLEEKKYQIRCKLKLSTRLDTAREFKCLVWVSILTPKLHMRILVKGVWSLLTILFIYRSLRPPPSPSLGRLSVPGYPSPWNDILHFG